MFGSSLHHHNLSRQLQLQELSEQKQKVRSRNGVLGCAKALDYTDDLSRAADSLHSVQNFAWNTPFAHCMLCYCDLAYPLGNNCSRRLDGLLVKFVKPQQLAWISALVAD